MSEQTISDKVSGVAEEILKDLTGKGEVRKREVMDNIIAFMSAAGGAGASTLAANVATAIRQKNLSVLVIDMNILYPMQQNYLGVKQEISKPDLVSFLTGHNTIGESIAYANDMGVLVSNNRNVVDCINCDCRQASDNLERGLERMSELFDVVVIDATRDLLSDINNTALYKADTIYNIWDENVECVAGYDRLLRGFSMTGISTRKIRVVMNKRTSVYYPKYIFKDIDKEPVVVLPFDISVIESGLRGAVFVKDGSSMSYNGIQFGKRLNKLTDNLLEYGGYKGDKAYKKKDKHTKQAKAGNDEFIGDGNNINDIDTDNQHTQSKLSSKKSKQKQDEQADVSKPSRRDKKAEKQAAKEAKLEAKRLEQEEKQAAKESAKQAKLEAKSAKKNKSK